MTLKQDDAMSLENDLFRKYPKQAIRGKDLVAVLDTEWKKAFVSFIAATLAGMEVSRKTLLLSDQISDGLDEIMKKEIQVKWDAKYEPELKIIFRIKNFLLAGHEVILPFVKDNDAILMASKKKMDEQLMKNREMPATLVMSPDFYDYYVASKAMLIASQDENMTLVKGIDETIPKCFAEAIKAGIDFKALEASATESTNTRADLRAIFAKVIQSTGLDVKV